jgi:hypothetical protein
MRGLIPVDLLQLKIAVVDSTHHPGASNDVASNIFVPFDAANRDRA